MLVKTGGKTTDSDISAMLELQGGVTNSGVENEMFILRSHQLVREVVKRLHLDVSYQEEGFFRNTTLYAESPVEMNFIDPYHANYSANVIPVDTKTYLLNGKSYHYGDTIQTQVGRAIVNLKPENLTAFQNKPVLVLSLIHI